MSHWTLFSNHGHVLLYLAKDPDARLRDVAAAVGITERAVQKIVRDLQDGGILDVSKHGRRNRYRVNTRKPLRHRLESHRTVGNLVKLIVGGKKSKRRKKKAEPESRPDTESPGGKLPSERESIVKEGMPQKETRSEIPPPPEPPPAPEPEPEPAAVRDAPVERESQSGSEPVQQPSPAGKRTRPAKKKPTDDQQGSLF